MALERWRLAIERETAQDARDYKALLGHLEAVGPEGQTLGEVAQAIGRDAYDTAGMLCILARAGLVENVPNCFPTPQWRAKSTVPLCDCGRTLGIHPRGYVGKWERCRREAR